MERNIRRQRLSPSPPPHPPPFYKENKNRVRTRYIYFRIELSPCIDTDFFSLLKLRYTFRKWLKDIVNENVCLRGRKKKRSTVLKDTEFFEENRVREYIDGILKVIFMTYKMFK